MVDIGHAKEVKIDRHDSWSSKALQASEGDNHKITPESVQLQMLPIGSQEKEQGFMTKKTGWHWGVKECLSLILRLSRS